MKILVILSIIPSIIIAYLVYKADKVEREPKIELAKSFIIGMFSIVVTLLLSDLFGAANININNLNEIELLLYTFAGIAFIEELSKWICTRIYLRCSNSYNYLFDGIVYSVYVSLGFATIENIIYTLTGGIITGIIRGIVTVPSHAFYAIFMGYYLACSHDNKNNKKLAFKYLLYSLLIPVILHGIFDSLLLLGNNLLLLSFIIFIIILYIISIKKLKKLSVLEHRFDNKIIICSKCGSKIYNKYCNKCDKD